MPKRIFCYRTLRFARNDKTALSGFDENFYAENANTKKRSLNEILEEFKLVRQSTIALFKSFDKEVLHRTGISFNTENSVLALGFTMCGHVIHHTNVLKDRYYLLI